MTMAMYTQVSVQPEINFLTLSASYSNTRYRYQNGQCPCELRVTSDWGYTTL